jgi:hypothetical protein
MVGLYFSNLNVGKKKKISKKKSRAVLYDFARDFFICLNFEILDS